MRIFLFQNQAFIFIAFLVFEVCVGIFWPAVSTMRGKYVPESSELPEPHTHTFTGVFLPILTQSEFPTLLVTLVLVLFSSSGYNYEFLQSATEHDCCFHISSGMQ